MKRYKKPETRIKQVIKNGVTKYYAEYRLGFILGWQFIRPCLTASDYIFTSEEAQSRIDDFLRRDFHRWTSGVGKTGRKSKPIVKNHQLSRHGE
jgi:hypothetical protein